MSTADLDRAIELMREAQCVLEEAHPVVAAHLETAIGLATERYTLDSARRATA